MAREILSLKREDDGSFGIYIDGELDETYVLNDEYPEVAVGVLPIKLWRAFNKALAKREKQIDKNKKREKLTIFEWMDKIGVDRAYKKDMKSTWDVIDEALDMQIEKLRKG